MKPVPQDGAGCAPIPETVGVGIHVGGPRKGFHAVALRDGVCRNQFASPDPLAVAAWCIQVGARAVASDAPCRWSRAGRARLVERALAAEGIHAFATPSLEAAEGRDFYRWMLNGAALNQATIDPDRNRWELCSQVLARRDGVGERSSVPW